MNINKKTCSPTSCTYNTFVLSLQHRNNTKTNIMNATDFLTLGQKVNKDGFEGVVVRFYTDKMVEVRLNSGLVCVDFRDLKSLETNKFFGR